MPPLIYLFEDDESLREVLAELVRDELGGDVEACASVGMLRERCATRRPDLIVADFWGTSHLHLAAAERTEIAELGSIAPLLLVSARAWAQDVESSELGLVALLPKPLDMDTFVRLARRALDSQPGAGADDCAAEQVASLPPRDALGAFAFGCP